MDPIWVNEPRITEKMVKYANDAVKSTWISSMGKYIEKFEEEFARYIGTKYATVCSNGTVSLQLALVAMGVGKGDEVIIPDQTIISCAFAPTYLGATPVVVDVDKNTFCINPSLIEEKITDKTKAIMPVHLYGQSCDMDAILEIAKKHNLYVLEDSAEAVGAEYRGRKPGSMGTVGSFSLYANKLVTSGEGGVLTTNDKNIYEKMRSLKNLAHSKGRRFWHEEIGYNFRMTNVQAALALASLEDIEESLEKKQKMASTYSERLKNVKGLRLPITAPYNNINSYWMYTIIVEDEFGVPRDELMRRLWDEYKVQTRTFFYPIHEQPVFKKLGWYKNEKYPVSTELSQRGLYLPSGLTLSEGQINHVCDSIKKIYLSSCV